MHYVQEHYFKDTSNHTVCNINKMLMLQREHLITLTLAISSLNQASASASFGSAHEAMMTVCLTLKAVFSFVSLPTVAL